MAEVPHNNNNNNNNNNGGGGGGTKRDFAAFLDDGRVEKDLWLRKPFSDWKIEVVPKTAGDDESSAGSGEEATATATTSTTATKTYNVHRCILAQAGPRSSAYFQGLLLRADDQFSESTNSTSRIELHPLAAKAFPLLLNYIYSSHEELKVATDTATALCFLGDYFGIKGISEEAMKYIEDKYPSWSYSRPFDSSMTETFLEHAMIFQNSAILEVLADYVGRHIPLIQPSSSIVKMAHPDFWLKVWGSVSGSNRSQHMSLIAAESLTCYKDNLPLLKLETFHGLTSARNLPIIHRNAALPLCQAEDNILKSPSSVEPNGNVEAVGKSSDMTDLQKPEEVSELQKRCAVSLHGAWIKEDISDTEKAVLCHRKGPFLVDLLINHVEHLRRAQEELRVCKEDLNESKQELGKCKKRLRRTKRFIKYLKTDIKKGQLRYKNQTDVKLPDEYVRQHSGETHSNIFLHRPKDDYEYPVFYFDWFFFDSDYDLFNSSDSDSDSE